MRTKHLWQTCATHKMISVPVSTRKQNHRTACILLKTKRQMLLCTVKHETSAGKKYSSISLTKNLQNIHAAKISSNHFIYSGCIVYMHTYLLL